MGTKGHEIRARLRVIKLRKADGTSSLLKIAVHLCCPPEKKGTTNIVPLVA